MAREFSRAPAPMVLPAPPADLCPALRELARAAFQLEERIHAGAVGAAAAIGLDAEMVAFADAQVRARRAFRAWKAIKQDHIDTRS